MMTTRAPARAPFRLRQLCAPTASSAAAATAAAAHRDDRESLAGVRT